VATISLGRLAPDRLPEVIERPAQRAGVDSNGLVAAMVEETSSGAVSGGDPAIPVPRAVNAASDAIRE
jgi:hypothetical protein